MSYDFFSSDFSLLLKKVENNLPLSFISTMSCRYGLSKVDGVSGIWKKCLTRFDIKNRFCPKPITLEVVQ